MLYHTRHIYIYKVSLLYEIVNESSNSQVLSMPYHILHTVIIKWWNDNQDRHIIYNTQTDRFEEILLKSQVGAKPMTLGSLDQMLVYQLSYWDSTNRD